MLVNVACNHWKVSRITMGAGLALTAGSVLAQDFGQWQKNPVLVPAPISTGVAEGCQFVTSDGLTMYFARIVSGLGNELFVSTRSSKAESFGAPVQLVNLSTTANEICPSLSPDGMTLYFVSNRGDAPAGCGKNDIFRTTVGTGPADWGNPARLACGSINTTADEEGPQFHVAADGATLYFSSNRLHDANATDYDIYAVGGFDPISGTTANPVAPVPGVNTSVNDRRGTIRADGMEIIVESDREGSSFDFVNMNGVATYNLWQLTRESLDAPFSKPKAVDRLNSYGDEARPTLVGDGGEIYFMSNRPASEGGAGGNDIWHATRPNGGEGENEQ